MLHPPRRQRFFLILEDLGGPSPAYTRLRRLIKAAGRYYGLRVIDYRELPAPQTVVQAAPQKHLA